MEEFNVKDYEYFDYICEHKRNLMKSFDILVYTEWCVNGCVGARLTHLEDDEILELKNRILTHDLSKFSSEEFYDYRAYFFSLNEEEKITSNFNKAWENHYTKNPHHPEHNHLSKMSKVDMLEMILDWVAMSIKFKDNPFEYFKNKKDKLMAEFGDKIDYEYVNMVLANISCYSSSKIVNKI